jgi:hypothetical protein
LTKKLRNLIVRQLFREALLFESMRGVKLVADPDKGRKVVNTRVRYAPSCHAIA